MKVAISTRAPRRGSGRRHQFGRTAFTFGLPIVIGLVVSRLSPHGINDTSAGASLQGPSWSHPFGTDQVGRDVFTRVFAAVPVNLAIALAAVTLPFVFGTVIGSILGVAPSRRIRGAIETVLEGITSLPLIILAMAVLAIVGPGPAGLIGAIVATNWARYARIAAAAATKLRSIEYVEATRMLNYSWPRIITRHVVPNAFRETLAYAYNDVVLLIMLVASLSFLGLGVRPPTPELGAMIRDGRLFLDSAPWVTLFPGAVIVLLSIAFARLAIKQGAGSNVV